MHSLHIIVFFLYVFGLHTHLSIALRKGVPWPAAACAVAALLSIPLLARDVFVLKTRRLSLLLPYIVLSIGITLYSGAQSDYFVEAFKGVLQLVYSLILAAIFYHIVRKFPKDRLASICLFLICGLGLVTLLESIGIAKTASDSFRSITVHLGRYSSYGGGFYDNEARDISLHGIVRAKAFALEPSFAAITFFWLSMVYLWSCRVKLWPMICWLGPIALATWTIRSPIFILTFLIGLTMVVFRLATNRTASNKLETKLLVIYVSALAIACIAGGLGIFFAERLRSLSDGSEGSFAKRLIGPLLFTGEFLKTHPFAGVGVVGDLTMLVRDITSFYSSINISFRPDALAEKGICNCLALHFIYFGGLSGIVTLATLLRVTWIDSMRSWLMLLIQLCCVWISMGGYNTPYPWCISAALIAAAENRVDAG